MGLELLDIFFFSPKSWKYGDAVGVDCIVAME